jgi:hypothetical protein
MVGQVSERSGLTVLGKASTTALAPSSGKQLNTRDQPQIAEDYMILIVDFIKFF